MFLKLFKQSQEQLSDLELVDRYRETDREELVGELFERYTHLVFGVCLKYLKHEEEAKDAVIALFEKLLTSLKTNQVQNFPAWLHQVTKNHCLMQLRSQKTKDGHHEKYETEMAADMESAQFTHHDSESRQVQQREDALMEAMEQLPDGQQTCLQLFYLEDKSYKEVAEQTGLPMKKVKSHIQNGKRQLKKLLGNAVVLLPLIKTLY
jgi:RNA polymerase sigma-70 factor (ECF subfamily)